MTKKSHLDDLYILNQTLWLVKRLDQFRSFKLLSIMITLCSLLCASSPSRAYAQELFEFSAPSSQTPPAKVDLSSDKSPTYKILPLRPKYIGEFREGVVYLSSAQRGEHRVHFKGGLLYNARGEKINSGRLAPSADPIKIPSPQPSPERSSELGFAIYVMDQEGRFYIHFKPEKGRIHHSSLLAGQPVACAGEILVFDGVLRAINNQSGHYQPPPAALRQALHALGTLGVDLKRVSVERFGIDL
jgi:hypothetical protein